MIFILVGFFLILFLPIFLILYSNGFIKKYHHINFSDNKQSIKEIKRDISYKLIEENEAEGMLGKASSKVNGMKKNNAEFGLAAICIGGGEASAVIIKNL